MPAALAAGTNSRLRVAPAEKKAMSTPLNAWAVSSSTLWGWPLNSSVLPAERFEATLIEAYLPSQLSDEELGQLVSAAIEETGASEQRQMGQVMSALMPKVGGRADGKRVSQAVREKLGA